MLTVDFKLIFKSETGCFMIAYNGVFWAVTNCSHYIVTNMEKVTLCRWRMVLDHFVTCRSVSHHHLHLWCNQEVVGLHFQIVLPCKIIQSKWFKIFYIVFSENALIVTVRLLRRNNGSAHLVEIRHACRPSDDVGGCKSLRTLQHSTNDSHQRSDPILPRSSACVTDASSELVNFTGIHFSFCFIIHHKWQFKFYFSFTSDLKTPADVQPKQKINISKMHFIFRLFEQFTGHDQVLNHSGMFIAYIPITPCEASVYCWYVYMLVHCCLPAVNCFIRSTIQPFLTAYSKYLYWANEPNPQKVY